MYSTHCMCISIQNIKLHLPYGLPDQPDEHVAHVLGHGVTSRYGSKTEVHHTILCVVNKLLQILHGTSTLPKFNFVSATPFIKSKPYQIEYSKSIPPVASACRACSACLPRTPDLAAAAAAGSGWSGCSLGWGSGEGQGLDESAVWSLHIKLFESLWSANCEILLSTSA